MRVAVDFKLSFERRLCRAGMSKGSTGSGLVLAKLLPPRGMSPAHAYLRVPLF